MNFILDFKDDLTQEYVDSYLATRGYTKLQTYSSFKHVYLVSCDQTPTVDTDLVSVVADDDHEIELHADSYRTFDNSTEENWWKMAVISNPNFETTQQQLLVRGSRATIYIMDSGIEHTHPEFAGSNITLLHSFNGDFIDRIGHGTGIASLMVGATAGISNAKLKVVKITDPTKTTKTSDLLAAFDAIVADHAANGSPVSVVNISWNIVRNLYVESKINALMDAGIFVVAAAGNQGQPIQNLTPASMFSVITIGAFNQNLEPCSFSNYNGPDGDLDGWAPGEQIYVAQLNGGFGFIQGTSCSTAIASATLAYNLDYFVLDDNGYFASETIINSDTARAQRRLIFPRQDILMLEGQYADSPNSIATVLTKGSFADNDSSHVVSLFVSGKLRNTWVFTNENVASTTFSVPLPAGLTLSNGHIIGTLPETETRYIYETVVTIAYNDGTQRDVSVKIHVLPPNIVADDLPVDDEIKVYLAMGAGMTCMMTVTAPAQCTGQPCSGWGCVNFGFATAKNPGSCYCGQ